MWCSTETWIYSAIYTVTQADINAGTDLVNVATVDTDQTDPDEDDATSTVDQNPSIKVTKSLGSYDDNDASADITLGDELFYTFEVENNGNVTLTNVAVTDDTFGLTVTCLETTLDPDDITTCATGVTAGSGHVVTVAESDAAESINSATATGTPQVGDPVDDDDTLITPVVQDPSISIKKDFAGDEQETVTAGGDPSSFTLVVTNTGNVTLGVLIEDDVDDRLTVSNGNRDR